MEPVAAVVMALALGAQAALKDVASQALKDAYTGLKASVRNRFGGKVDVEQLERAPSSKGSQNAAREELRAAGAECDPELAAKVQELLELIRREAPAAADAIGVDLREVKAANLRLKDIAALGTGVKLERGKFTGDINITGVRAGLPPGAGRDTGEEG
jgi:hypothetical protein